MQKVIGHPTAKQLSYLLDHHLIPNSPFTSHDVRKPEQIYSPDLGNLKGKTTRCNPPTLDQIMQQCPNTIIEQYGNIMLSADVMHVNGIPFFVTRSHHIHFGTVDVLPSLQAIDIGAVLRCVVNIYARGGFQVTIEYVQTHEEHDNSLLSRTVGAIALRPTGNQQGGYFFMSLHTGRIINCLHAKKLPMPSEVIIRVDQLAKAQNMIPSLAFGNRDNWLITQDIIDDDETENAYIPTDEADSTLYYDQEPSMTQMVNNDTATDINEDNDNPHNDMPTDVTHMNDAATVSTMTNELTTPTGAGNNQVIPLSGVVEENDQNEDDQDDRLCLEEDIETPMNTSYDESNQKDEQQNIATVPMEDTADKTMDDKMDAKYGTRSTRWNLRQRKQRTYDHKYDEHAEIYVTQSSEATLATLQMPICRGLKLFGSQGISAVKAELQQLHDPKVMEAKPLTTTQKREALGYLMFLKRKRSGKIKARGCADGRPQWAYTTRGCKSTYSINGGCIYDSRHRCHGE